MPISPQAYALATSFHYLRGFQSACSFNTNVLSMDPLTFANSTIATILPSAPYQNQFLQSATANTGLNLTTQDLTTNSTFLDLLNQYRPLQIYFGNYLLSMAASPYSSDTLQAFTLVLASSAFPGGCAGVLWMAVQAVLTGANPSIVPPECYTAAQQTKVANQLGSSSATMDDIVTTLAGLG
jgi:hypothetical protein